MAASTLDIVVPCYNPAKGWAENVVRSYTAITGRLPGIECALILVNDGSSKGIQPAEIEYIGSAIASFTYLQYDINKGKGAALRTGVSVSRADICIYTDIDFPYTESSVIKIWEMLKSGTTDIAAGIKDKNYYKHVPAVRRMISKLLRACSKFILRLKVSDTQCGLKGFNAAGKQIFLSTTIDRYLFDLEFIFLASRRNDISMQPVEIELKENVQFSSMRFSILFNEGINFLKIFFKRF